jgi:hypothetical protein
VDEEKLVFMFLAGGQGGHGLVPHLIVSEPLLLPVFSPPCAAHRTSSSTVLYKTYCSNYLREFHSTYLHEGAMACSVYSGGREGLLAGGDAKTKRPGVSTNKIPLAEKGDERTVSTGRRVCHIPYHAQLPNARTCRVRNYPTPYSMSVPHRERRARSVRPGLRGAGGAGAHRLHTARLDCPRTRLSLRSKYVPLTSFGIRKRSKTCVSVLIMQCWFQRPAAGLLW